MGCACRNRKNKDGSTGQYSVKLKGGITIKKGSETEAKAFAAKHPGSTVVKSA